VSSLPSASFMNIGHMNWSCMRNPGYLT
jgi:hypothetical protein